jgi:hypothetical protein
MATHLEDAQRLSNATYQFGWLIRPLWPPQTWQVARTGIHPRFLLTNHRKRFSAFAIVSGPLQCRQEDLEVAVRPRKGSAAIRSRCHLPVPGYDQLPYLADPRYEGPKAIGAFLTFLHGEMYPGFKL